MVPTLKTKLNQKKTRSNQKWQPAPKNGGPRDVFLYFISGAKEKAPAAAMALIRTLG